MSFIFTKFLGFIDNSYMFNFLDANLITIQVTLLAIVTGTFSFVIPRISEILENKPDKKDAIFKEYKLRFYILLGSIAVSLIVLFIKHSESFNAYSQYFNILLIAIFICCIDFLREIVNSLFLIYEKPKINNTKDYMKNNYIICIISLVITIVFLFIDSESRVKIIQASTNNTSVFIRNN